MTLLNNFTFPAFLSSSNLFISTEEHGNETFKTKKEQRKKASLLYLPWLWFLLPSQFHAERASSAAQIQALKMLHGCKNQQQQQQQQQQRNQVMHEMHCRWQPEITGITTLSTFSRMLEIRCIPLWKGVTEKAGCHPEGNIHHIHPGTASAPGACALICHINKISKDCWCNLQMFPVQL